MIRFRFGWVVFALALWAPQVASAHFLWLVRDAGGQPGKMQVYFGEVAEPDDPGLLERVQAAQVWALPGRGEPQALSLTRVEDELVAELPPAARQATVVLRHTYGVMTRGDASFLLNYYAKSFPSPLPGTWREANDPERLPLEITPTVEGKEIVLYVAWKGQPVAGATIAIHGPGVDLEGTTNEKGVFRGKFPEEGRYSVLARYLEKTPGKHDGKSYTEVRHYTTLALEYTPAQLAPVAHNLADLPQGMTSLGAAVAGDALYVYGGNYGNAHEYSKDGQSGDLWKLDLKNPTAWEKLPGGPKLQGLAMVEHQGQLYRVGGFTAMNEEGEDQDLRSQANFARFDPQKRAWEELPGLAEPRSSHDAAVLDGVLYVVGGWNLQGESGESKWHDTALAIDLKADQPQWKAIAAPPFQRRAVAVAAWNGKIYCLGGMQQKGGPTTAVAVYETAQDTWTEGPMLLGGAMDGFGASAFACGDALYATTITGSIQRLAGEGKSWEYLGQLDHPRFFHRLIALNEKQLVAVGGGSMSVGKIVEIEVIPANPPKQQGAQ